MNKRRKLLVALGAGALAAPFAAFAQQQGKVWRVGFLGLSNRQAFLNSNSSASFLQGMRELGYVEGKNLAIEWRFADNNLDRLSELAAELVQLKMDVILAGGNDAPLALHKATTTIPIIMGSTSDPVGLGLIKSLARPGGNITGVSTISTDLGPKRFELLLSMLPKLSRVAVLMHPASASHGKLLESIQAEGRKRRITILRAVARTPQEIDKALSSIRQQNAGALMVSLHPFFQQQINQIAELTLKHRLPSMTADREYAEAGCLMSYGSTLADRYRRAATYVDKIFKGAKPADLPVEQPTKFELVINGKTAKALGLKIPQSLLVLADKVIE
jgi:putative tryptophan/tyrosine transport system substrate-binding protein